MNYKLAFWITVAIFVALIIVASLALDRTILTKWHMLTTPVPSLSETVTYLPSEYYKDQEFLTHAYEKHVQKIEDFAPWREAVIQEKYGNYLNHKNFSIVPTLISSQSRDGYTLEKYSAPSHFGVDDILFYKMVPNVPLNKAILAIPGSGNQGFKDIVGEPSQESLDYYQNEIGKRLVLEGYTIYAIELHGFGERRINFTYCVLTFPNPYDCNIPLLTKMLSQYGISLFDIQRDDLHQITSLIDSEFDRVGLIGLSLGSAHAVNQGITNSDVYDAVASASGHFSSHEHPAVLGYGTPIICCDGRDLLATMTPKPLYLSVGTRESPLPVFEANTGYTHDFVADVYRFHNSSENFVSVVHDGGHEYHVESVIKFFADHL